MFNHIHGHSHYSLLHAIWDLKAIAKKIKSLGQETMPISDYNGMYGSIQQYEIAKKEGLKPLVGVELCTHVVREGKFEKPCYTTLLAKNYEWYRMLLELVSEAHTASAYTIPHFPLEKIKDRSENLIAVIGGEHSYLCWLLHQGESQKKIEELMDVHCSFFPEWQFFFEITAQPHINVPHLKKINNAIDTLSESLDIPCVVDNNFHYVSSEEKDAFDIATCIKDGKQYYEHGRKKKEGERHIMSEDEITKVMEKNGYTETQISGFITNNQSLIDMIDVNIPLHQLLFPVYESPGEIKDLYAKFQSENP